MTLQDLAHLLNGKVSDGQILCPGPNHGPSDRSLSVKLDAKAPDGFILYSFAGDDLRTCREHVNEKIGGLLDEIQPNESYPQPGCDLPLKCEVTHSDDGLLDDCTRSMNGRKPDITYLYRTETGDGIHYAVARWEPQNEGEEKKIRPFVFDGQRWRSKGHPAPRPLYNLDKISGAKDKPVLIVEGEKSAEAASTFYVGPVTTWCGGAEAVSKTDFGPLRGRDVVLCPDNDDPGRNAMAESHGALSFMGLPGAPSIGWSRSGGLLVLVMGPV